MKDRKHVPLEKHLERGLELEQDPDEQPTELIRVDNLPIIPQKSKQKSSSSEDDQPTQVLRYDATELTDLLAGPADPSRLKSNK